MRHNESCTPLTRSGARTITKAASAGTGPLTAATPTDRGECAASADRPDLGFAACSRIIDDADVPLAERVTAFKNRGTAHDDFETRHPGGAFEVIDRPHARNFYVAERGLSWKNDLDIVSDDAAMVWLCQIGRRSGRRPVLNDLAARATAHSQGNG